MVGGVSRVELLVVTKRGNSRMTARLGPVESGPALTTPLCPPRVLKCAQVADFVIGDRPDERRIERARGALRRRHRAVGVGGGRDEPARHGGRRFGHRNRCAVGPRRRFPPNASHPSKHRAAPRAPLAALKARSHSHPQSSSRRPASSSRGRRAAWAGAAATRASRWRRRARRRVSGARARTRTRRCSGRCTEE